MTEAQWINSQDPAAMLEFLGVLPWGPARGRRLSNRKLRLFAAACHDPDPYWRAWAEGEGEGPRLSAQDGALIAAGAKDPEHHPEARRPEEMRRRAALLRDVAGNPFKVQSGLFRVARAVGCVPWLTPEAVSIAAAAYDERDWGRLPVLADALEEAGADCEDLLGHLRGRERCRVCLGRGSWEVYVCSTCLGSGSVSLPGPHTRGCWAVDLILNQE